MTTQDRYQLLQVDFYICAPSVRISLALENDDTPTLFSSVVVEVSIIQEELIEVVTERVSLDDLPL